MVASEPFDKEAGWNEVPPNHVLVAPAAGTIDIVPFLPPNVRQFPQEQSRIHRVVQRASIGRQEL